MSLTTGAKERLKSLADQVDYHLCRNCAHPLSDNRLVQDAYKLNTTASWAKQQLIILAQMAEDHKMPEFYIHQVKKIMNGISLLTDIRGKSK